MGAPQKNIIEINGKKYDASTGMMLDHQSEVASTSVAKKPPQTGAVDGFSRKKHNNPHTEAAHSKKHVQKSKTLMRSAVKKPNPAPKKEENHSRHKDPVTKSHLGISKKRLHVAKNTQKSSQINKYDSNHLPESSVVKKVQPVPVKKPTHTPHHKTDNKVSHPNHHKTHKTKTASAVMVDNALASATAHNQPHHEPASKQRKLHKKFGISPRAAGISAAVLAGVLLGGFYAIQNVPNLSMRVAAARAGFNAKMPGYNPSGFSYQGPINYRPGQVTISFRSNTDDRNYAVTQRASDWNSDALLANYVADGDKQYQTYLDRGRTLYIYDGSNATWVNNGVWYQVEGDSDMTTDQLVRIAGSM